MTKIKNSFRTKVSFKRPSPVTVKPALDILFVNIETLTSMPEVDWFLTFLSIKVSTEISVCSIAELSFGKLWSKHRIS